MEESEKQNGIWKTLDDLGNFINKVFSEKLTSPFWLPYITIFIVLYWKVFYVWLFVDIKELPLGITKLDYIVQQFPEKIILSSFFPNIDLVISSFVSTVFWNFIIISVFVFIFYVFQKFVVNDWAFKMRIWSKEKNVNKELEIVTKEKKIVETEKATKEIKEKEADKWTEEFDSLSLLIKEKIRNLADLVYKYSGGIEHVTKVGLDHRDIALFTSIDLVKVIRQQEISFGERYEREIVQITNKGNYFIKNALKYLITNE